MKLHIGDHVVVISGKDKGKTGAVLRVLAAKNRVVIGGINMRTRHMRATPQQPGQKIQYEASIDVSNVMLLDPKTKKRTRVGSKTDSKGKKVRFAKRSGEVLPTTKAGATTGTSTKKDSAKSETKKTTAAKKDDKKDDVKATSAMPEKKPFWKKALNFGGEEMEGMEDAPVSAKDHSIPEQTPPQQTRSSSRSN